MNFSKKITTFFSNEDGAITVDWVVLTAGIAMMGLAVAIGIGSATQDVTGKITTFIDSTDPQTY